MGKASRHKIDSLWTVSIYNHAIWAQFSSMMDLLTKDICNFAAAYLDDVIINSDTWENHLQHPTIILEQLCKANLTV